MIFAGKGVDTQTIYGKMFDRIQDLNRVSFQYRFIYLALIAGYYTSLSFVNDIAAESIFFNTIVAHELIIVTLTVAALVGVICIYFFECLNQELVEHCVSSIRNIENEENITMEYRIFSHHASTIISYRFAVIITLLYFVPGAGLMLYLTYFVSNISLALDSTPFLIARAGFCQFGFDGAISADKLIGEVTTTVDLPTAFFAEMWSGLCEGSATYDEALLKAVLYGYTIALAFCVLFVILTLQRLAGRLLLVARFRNPYAPSLLNKKIKRSVDVVAIFSTTVVTIFFILVFIGIYLEWEKSYRFVTYWLLDRDQPNFVLVFPDQ